MDIVLKNSERLEEEYFDFIYKRQLIWYNRFVLKQLPPWTEDEVLGKYKIINVYRELDKCTIYLLGKLDRIKDRETLLLNIVFYRFFNQVNLYEKLGIEPFDYLDNLLADRIIGGFNEIKESGSPIFNNAYLISSGETGERKHISIIKNLRAIDFSELVKGIDCSKNPEESLRVIQKIPMVGPFLACEIWTDLSYFNFFRQGWTDDDFVNIGPGAKWGLEVIYGDIGKKKLDEKLHLLHEKQKDYLKNVNRRLGFPFTWEEIAFKEAFSNYPFLSITNIEGALCEFRKYYNISYGKGRRKYFKPSSYLQN